MSSVGIALSAQPAQSSGAGTSRGRAGSGSAGFDSELADAFNDRSAPSPLSLQPELPAELEFDADALSCADLLPGVVGHSISTLGQESAAVSSLSVEGRAPAGAPLPLVELLVLASAAPALFAGESAGNSAGNSVGKMGGPLRAEPDLAAGIIPPVEAPGGGSSVGPASTLAGSSLMPGDAAASHSLLTRPKEAGAQAQAQAQAQARDGQARVDAAGSAPAVAVLAPAGIPGASRLPGGDPAAAPANPSAGSDVGVVSVPGARLAAPEQQLHTLPPVAGAHSPAPSPTTSPTTAGAAVLVAASQAPALNTQLAGQVYSLVAGNRPGEHTMTLSVTPEDLGPVTVRAHIGLDGVRVELFAPSDAGREALRTILQDLKRDLAAAGLGADLNLSSRESPDGQSGEKSAREQASTNEDPGGSRQSGIRDDYAHPSIQPDGTPTGLDVLA